MHLHILILIYVRKCWKVLDPAYFQKSEQMIKHSNFLKSLLDHRMSMSNNSSNILCVCLCLYLCILRNQDDATGHIISDIILRSLKGFRSLNIISFQPANPDDIDQIPAYGQIMSYRIPCHELQYGQLWGFLIYTASESFNQMKFWALSP